MMTLIGQFEMKADHITCFQQSVQINKPNSQFLGTLICRMKSPGNNVHSKSTAQTGHSGSDRSCANDTEGFPSQINVIHSRPSTRLHLCRLKRHALGCCKHQCKRVLGHDRSGHSRNVGHYDVLFTCHLKIDRIGPYPAYRNKSQLG